MQISKQSKIFSPANLRTARHELPGYGELIDYWLDERYTLRFCGGLVPDLCQQFSKGQGILTNPPGGATAPAKLRLAFECAPFSLLVETAGGTFSENINGKTDIVVTGDFDNWCASTVFFGQPMMSTHAPVGTST